MEGIWGQTGRRRQRKGVRGGEVHNLQKRTTHD